ncbi:FkbM family methyltransferase [Roseivirga sp.]|uniref:FkbM family methyltransferase n=1 Tax=Roseivirga sp. TaxID=1964215 RepID=UPI003B8DC9AE
MSKLKQFFKEFLYSSNCPWLLSKMYFEKKDANARKQLLKMIKSSTDLMKGVPENAKKHWASRIQNVLVAEDNAFIPRHEEAGKLKEDWLVMHNGLKIDPMSYYGFGLMKMLVENKGVHEPQEELIFHEVLKQLSTSKPLTMLELGSYWSFYSMWLSDLFPKSDCFMVEPDKKNLYYGKRNFHANGFEGKFIHAGIGKSANPKKNIRTVDELCANNNIEFLDILHADIQGFELEMLEGSQQMISDKRIGYAFISTHSNELHNGCRNFLLKHDFVEVASANVDESYSWDGILVMKSRHYEGLDTVGISKRQGK